MQNKKAFGYVIDLFAKGLSLVLSTYLSKLTSQKSLIAHAADLKVTELI